MADRGNSGDNGGRGKNRDFIGAIRVVKDNPGEITIRAGENEE